MVFLPHSSLSATMGSIFVLRRACPPPASQAAAEPSLVAQALLPVPYGPTQAGVPVSLALAHDSPSCSAGMRIRAIAPASFSHLLVSTASRRRPLAVSR